MAGVLIGVTSANLPAMKQQVGLDDSPGQFCITKLAGLNFGTDHSSRVIHYIVVYVHVDCTIKRFVLQIQGVVKFFDLVDFAVVNMDGWEKYLIVQA